MIRWRRLPNGDLRLEIWPLVILAIVLLGAIDLWRRLFW